MSIRGLQVSSTVLNILAIDTPAGFANLRDDWNTLADATADTVFLSHSWLANWLRYLGGAQTPHVLVATDGARLVGALPLSLSVRGPAIRTLRFIGTGTLTPNHLDVLAYPEYRDDVLSAFVSYLLEERQTWDVLDFDKLPEDSPTASELHSALLSAGLSSSVVESALCPYAVLPATYDEFFSGLSKSARRHTRERIRCISREHPGAVFGMVESEEELAVALDALVRLHQQRWEARGYAGSFSDPRVIAFHEATTLDALQRGKLRFYTLRDGDDVAAAVLCYRANGSVQAYSCAFEPSWASYRPGMVLGAYAIERSIGEGAERYDHLEGDESHKATWAGSVRRNVRVRAFCPGVRGRLAKYWVRTGAAVIPAARRIVPGSVRQGVRKRLSRMRARL